MDAPETEQKVASTRQPMSAARAWLIAGMVGLVLLAVVGGVFLANRESSQGSSSSASIQGGGPVADRPITAGWMQGGCEAWVQGAGDATGPSSAWCSSMAAWMAANGWGGAPGQDAPMMGSMMGADAERMRTACKAWHSTGSATTGASADWCDQMADWMLSNQGDWDNWNGPMMDGP